MRIKRANRHKTLSSFQNTTCINKGTLTCKGGKKKLKIICNQRFFRSAKSDFPCLSNVFCEHYLDRPAGRGEENHNEKPKPNTSIGCKSKESRPEGAAVPGEGSWSSGAPSPERSLHLLIPALPILPSSQFIPHSCSFLIPIPLGLFLLRLPGSILALGCLT